MWTPGEPIQPALAALHPPGVTTPPPKTCNRSEYGTWSTKSTRRASPDRLAAETRCQYGLNGVPGMKRKAPAGTVR